MKRSATVANSELSPSLSVRPQWCSKTWPSWKSSKACPFGASGKVAKSGSAMASAYVARTDALIRGGATASFGSPRGTRPRRGATGRFLRQQVKCRAGRNPALLAGPSPATGCSRGPVYVLRSPTTGVLYGVVRTHLAEFLAAADAQTDGGGPPGFVVNEFRSTSSPERLQRPRL